MESWWCLPATIVEINLLRYYITHNSVRLKLQALSYFGFKFFQQAASILNYNRIIFSQSTVPAYKIM